MSKKRETCFACHKGQANDVGLCQSCQISMSMILALGTRASRYQKAAEAMFAAQIVYVKVGRAEAEQYLDQQLREAGLLGVPTC